MLRWYFLLSLVSSLGLAVCCSGATAGEIPLRSGATAYHILARSKMALKNYQLRSQGCNVGVNNRGGALGAAGPVFADNTQLVADLVQGLGKGGELFQIFSNEGSLVGVAVKSPGAPSNARFPGERFTPPILPAETDSAFIAACNQLPGGHFPAKFTAGSVNVVAKKGGGDCIFKCKGPSCRQVSDSQPHNGICDLPPGSYGTVNAKNAAKISFDGGIYNMAAYQNGKGVLILTKAPTTLNIGEASDLRLGDSLVIAVECGDLRVNFLGGKSASRDVSLGKHSRVTMDLCAPYARLRLGRSNMLTGHFFAGEVTADVDNQGLCCAGCACVDTFWPMRAGEGDLISLAGGCDLRNVSRVLICDQEARIVSRTSDGASVRVPEVGAPKKCEVKIESAAGVFVAAEKLEVESD